MPSILTKLKVKVNKYSLNGVQYIDVNEVIWCIYYQCYIVMITRTLPPERGGPEHQNQDQT